MKTLKLKDKNVATDIALFPTQLRSDNDNYPRVSVPDIKGFVDNPVVVDFEKLFTHRYTLANAATIRPIHSTNLIGSVKPEIGTTWGDIDAFVEIMRDLASNIPTRMLVEWSRGTEKEKNITVIRKISKSLKEIEIIFKKKVMKITKSRKCALY